MAYISTTIPITIAGALHYLKVNVPDENTQQTVLLPALWDLMQIIEDVAISKIKEEGKLVSCKKGCGICCNQLVPISQIEARYLSQHLNQMPKSKREKLQARFDEIYARCEQSGILEKILNSHIYNGSSMDLGLEYFNMGQPCPFLENNCCSIHKKRPLSCREYLVTNPPANCAHPRKENIQSVPIPVRLSNVLSQLHEPHSDYPHKWVPLSLTPFWVARHPQKPVLRHSTEWVDEAMNMLKSPKHPSLL